MKLTNLFPAVGILILSACSSPPKENIPAAQEKTAGSTISDPQAAGVSANQIQISVYDDPQFDERIKNQRESLNELSGKNVFLALHSKILPELDEKHREFFKAKPSYEIVSVSKGCLFSNNTEDYAFVVYDKQNVRIAVVLYNEQAKSYSELFRELKVKNGLKSADCNYSAFGTLDYLIAEGITDQAESLVKNPESYTAYSPCRIADISKDETFVLESGCFTKNTYDKTLLHSLCIATSTVYNDWECLKYDKAENIFLIYYGQAFAD